MKKWSDMKKSTKVVVAVVIFCVVVYLVLISYLSVRFGWWVGLIMLTPPIWVMVVENAWLQVRHEAVNQSGFLRNRLKVMQITDLHSTPFATIRRGIAKAVKNNTPDLIVLTGDTFEGHNQDVSHAEAMLRDLRLAAPTTPILAIWGNHEREYPQRLSEFEEIFQAHGVQLVGGRTITLSSHSDVTVSGADWASDEEFHLENSGFNLVLTHCPVQGAELISRSTGINMMLAGHLHGGQIRLPGIGAIMAADSVDREKRFFPDCKGFPTRGVTRDGYTTVGISSGAGFSLIPLRLFCRAEVVIYEID